MTKGDDAEAQVKVWGENGRDVEALDGSTKEAGTELPNACPGPQTFYKYVIRDRQSYSEVVSGGVAQAGKFGSSAVMALVGIWAFTPSTGALKFTESPMTIATMGLLDLDFCTAMHSKCQFCNSGVGPFAHFLLPFVMWL
jgi:hypothetical protein